ncbi:MAG: methyltransferase domain-containing protein [Peptostreptococcaceae bacterium]|nr:methyltransferase domain-containing protein [Peptostreptococcaceae bacterium]
MKNSFDDTLTASIYDHDNPDGPDHDFYRQLANDIQARSIIDLGCGTGMLTATLATEGREVIGIDPAPAMLEIARKRPNGECVTWIEGTADKIPTDKADLILMTGNAAMHIIGDEWHETLRYIARGLRKGGTLAFETRNPLAEDWKTWDQEDELRETPAGRLRESMRIDPPDENGVLTMNMINEFLDHDYKVSTKECLQFRSYEQVVKDLQGAGLSVKACYWNWSREAFQGTAKEKLMIFVATRDE